MQKENLLLLKAAIDPDNLLNWSPATDVCTQWEGVTCNAQGLVQEITLMDKVRTAGADAAVHALQQLRCACGMQGV